MKYLSVTTIPHKGQRYPTVGDYLELANEIKFFVSEMSDWRHEACVIAHEIVEKFLCNYRGIDEKKIDEFDKDYERNRLPGDTTEPGDHPDAPYRKEHEFATRIERLLAAELGLDWETYDKEVNSL